MVTLRRAHMYEFLDRLVNVSFPRIRDFKGFSPKAFDGRGSYSFGVTEQLIFPEVRYDDVVKPQGMDITICTSARDDRSAHALLTALGFPFRKEER